MATNKRLIKSNDEGGAGNGFFNTVLYDGNGSTQSVTGVGFQPDLVWIKCRTVSGESHWLTDSVRGAQKSLSSNQTIAEQNITNGLVSFDPDGFTVGSYTAFNSTSGGADNMVAWCWKAGGAAVTNNDGTITSQVSANVEAGFSIVSYTANGTSGATIGHGLSQEADLVIVKNTNLSTQSWNTYVKDVTDTNAKYLMLNNASGIGNTANPRFIVGNFSSDVFSVGNDNSTNGISGTDNYIAYCFHSVAGFSKFGSYDGTGAGVQNTINCGFAPRFVMIKRTNSTGGWRMFDNVRGLDKSIQAQSSGAEYDDTTNYLDFYANGFEFNNGVSYQSNPDINASGGEYIYMAFANQF